MKYKKTVLKNGLRVLMVPRPGSEAITLFVVVKVGSRCETPRLNGISHFLEHMMFKGTKRRPSTLEISKALDQVGAEYNAFTSKDHTAYYIKIHRSKIKLALDVLSDMVLSSKFDPAEVQREKGVIVEEINMYEDNPLMYVEDLFEQTVFGKHHPLGRLIAGSRANIRALRRSSVVDYFSRYYTARNAVVVVAGPVDNAVKKQITDYFGSWRRGRSVEPAPLFRRRQQQPRLTVQYKKTEQVQLCLGFPALSYTDRDLPALELLSIILGGNMSSRLFISIRERQGLAYFIHASVNPYEDTGAFCIQAGIDKTRLNLAVTAILEELKKVKRSGITDAELAKAKQFVRGKMILELEDSSHLASWYGRQEALLRKVETPEERLAKINAVTAFKLKRLAQRIFRKPIFNLAAIGPIRKTQPLKRIVLRSL